MIYLGENTIKEIEMNWHQNIDAIYTALQCIDRADISQPIKPYLRYGDPKNRIIAMPAYVGGEIKRSGIKWISSFPENIKKGIERAHSVIILNDAESGKPVSVINSGSLSAIRTASVSGLVLKMFMKARPIDNATVGIIGFGPVGKYHLSMCTELLGEKLQEVIIYDLKGVDIAEIPLELAGKIRVVDNWQEAYKNADVFMTCTVSKEPYIDLEPKSSSLHLNVSLRDYKTDVFPWFEKGMIVDDWNEVCREKTDIESFYKINGLTEDGVSLLKDVLHDSLSNIDKDQAILFNPMGMAVFDMAIANRYLSIAKETKTGVLLES